MKVAFVSCVKLKADEPRPARNLYVSPWFTMARRYAERNSDRWFILSAAHGLLDPHQEVEPYNVTLNDMKMEERRAWAKKVVRQMDDASVRGDEALVLAGLNYRRHLEMSLLDRFAEVDIGRTHARPTAELVEERTWKDDMKKLLLIILGLGLTPAQAYTFTYTCKDQGKTSQLKVDDSQNTLSWNGTTYKITETECGKAGWHAEKDGVSFDFCTATKGAAGFEFKGREVICDMKR